MASSLKDKELLYEKKQMGSNIVNKVIRYNLEKQLLKRANVYNNSRPQLAILAFDYVGVQILLDGIYEVNELEIFTEWLKSNHPQVFDGLAIDIGANIGNHAIYFSDYWKKVYAFEPHPLVYKILSVNSGLVDNVKCFNFGISSSERSASFSVNKRNMGGGFVSTGTDMSGDGESISLKRLDDVISESNLESNEVKLIKIDVEGHEYDALLGCEKTIKNYKPLIIFEQHESDFNDNSTKSIDLIKSYGYSSFVCIEKSPKPPSFFPMFLQLFYSTAYRFIVGSSMKIVKVSNIKPGFYPFIVAVPDWMQ